MPYRTRVRSRGEHSCPKPRVCVEATANSPVSPAACSHPTPRAPDPLSPSSILLCPSDPAGDSRSPQSTHPRGAARPGRGRAPLRQVWAPRGRARLPCLLRRPAECKPAVQQRRRAGSAPPLPPPLRLSGPPAPPPAASRTARPPASPPAVASPSPRRLPPASFTLPFRDPGPSGPAQVGLRSPSPPAGPPTRCSCTGSDGQILPVTLAPSGSRQLDHSTTEFMGLHCLESAEAMLQHGRSLPAFQSSSIPGA